MSDVIVKKGREIFINIETLEEIKNNLFGLPEKQRTLLKVKDAVAFLLPSILCAKEKNYSEPEILEHFERAGWVFTPDSARYLWRIVRSMTQGNKRKKNIGNYQQADNDSLLNASINSEVITNAIKIWTLQNLNCKYQRFMKNSKNHFLMLIKIKKKRITARNLK